MTQDPNRHQPALHPRSGASASRNHPDNTGQAQADGVSATQPAQQQVVQQNFGPNELAAEKIPGRLIPEDQPDKAGDDRKRKRPVITGGFPQT